MKKLIAMLLALAMVFAFAACGGEPTPSTAPSAGPSAEPSTAPSAEPSAEPSTEPAADYKVAMITDYGDITDQSFNQTTYEACKEYCEANSLAFSYFKPASDSDADRIAMVEKAIDEGYNVIVMPGYAFANTIKGTADTYSDIQFVALDVGEADLGADYALPSNVYCAVYQEELCGYMAGYAAVKLGYTKLGFLAAWLSPLSSAMATASCRVLTPLPRSWIPKWR